MSKRLDSNQAVSLRTLVSDTALFGIGAAADRVLGFLIFPLTARLLGSEGFGALSLFNTSVAIATIALSVGTPGAFFRYYSDRDRDYSPGQVVAGALWIISLFALLSALPLMAWAQPVSMALFNEPVTLLVLLLWVRALCASITSIGNSRMQADGSIAAFLKIQIVVSIASRGLGLALLLADRGVAGLIIGETIGASLGVALAAAYAFKGVHWKTPPALVWGLAKYGMSLVPGLLSVWVFMATDKYLLRILSPNPFQDIGLYSIAERVASVLIVINASTFPSWRRFSFQNMHLSEGPRLIARGASIYIVGCGYVALAASLLGNDFVHWLIGGEFEPGSAAIPLLVLSNLLGGFGEIPQIGLHKAKKPLAISVISALAALLNVLLNWILIPSYGFLGAAGATCVSQALRIASLGFYSQLLFPIPFEAGRLAKATAVFAGVYLLGTATDTFSWPAASASQTALVALAPAALYAAGFFAPQELQVMREGWAKARAFVQRFRP